MNCKTIPHTWAQHKNISYIHNYKTISKVEYKKIAKYFKPHDPIKCAQRIYTHMRLKWIQKKIYMKLTKINRNICMNYTYVGKPNKKLHCYIQWLQWRMHALAHMVTRINLECTQKDICNVYTKLKKINLVVIFVLSMCYMMMVVHQM